MFNSDVLDVALGMIFVYLILSLICSAAHEILELWLKKRAIDLERGLRELLDPDSESGTDGLIKDLYNHPLVNGLFVGSYEKSGIASKWRYIWGTRLPSYIPSRNFALGLMDLILPATEKDPSGAMGAVPPDDDTGGTTGPASASLAPNEEGNPLERLRSAIASTTILDQNENARRALLTVVDAAEDDVSKARENIEAWFNAGMERVSGWYKRRSQAVILVLGLFVAIALNADSVTIVKSLSTNRAVRESLVSAAQDYAKANGKPCTNCPPDATPLPACVRDKNSPECQFEKNLQTIQDNVVQKVGLPIGWIENSQDPKRNWAGLSLSAWHQQFHNHLFGWLLTAFAISLGAPFWFDLLNKLIVVRSTLKPEEKPKT